MPPPTTALNPFHIRAEFPAFASGLVYLDCAGAWLVLRRVAERVSDYLRTSRDHA